MSRIEDYGVSEYEYEIPDLRSPGEKFVDAVSNFFSGLSLAKSVADEENELENNGTLKRTKRGFVSFTEVFKNTKLMKSIGAISLASVMTFTAGCAANQFSNDEANATSIQMENDDEPLIPKDNLFNVLLNKSQSEKQREVLSSVGNFLADYNIRFADPIEDTVTLVHSETGEQKTITIRPALTWDEAMSMSLVYNNFSKNELIEILNGSEIDAYTLNNAYKMAILQLMGAHVLETSDNQVNIDMLIQSEEGKAFYEKYHNIFLKAKETTGEERLNNVKAFYDELYKDFPISAEVRQEGIAHSDARASIVPYKLSIIPMISASEIMFQNLEVDYTLTQEAIDYFNDIGGCNIAEDILEKAELVSLMTTPNEDYANYDEVRAALITFLVEKKAYVIDDDHRDLSDLPAFQEIVNGFLLQPYTYTVVTTHTVTTYHTVTEEIRTDDRDEAVELAGEDAVKEAEKKAQEQLEQENQQAKEEAEEEADKIAEEMQQEENEKAEDLEEQVEESDKEYQENIDDANQEINTGGTVNENDLGNGTDFDNEHSDSNGNLDNSVTDITTDGTGAVDSSDPLPDPNAEDYSTTSYRMEPASEADTTEVAPAATEAAESATTYESTVSESPVYEYEEPYTFTSEEEIDLYIESLASQPSSYDDTEYSHRL